MIHNPLDNPLFLPAALRVAVLLAAGALVVALVERGRLSHIRESVLFQRVYSWSVMAPVFLAAIFVGGPVGLLVIW